jgi:hypothetical protein
MYWLNLERHNVLVKPGERGGEMEREEGERNREELEKDRGRERERNRVRERVCERVYPVLTWRGWCRAGRWRTH